MNRLIATYALSLIGFIALQAQTQSGKASFYARKATGARTANGERLHHDSLTCAHRTYPFGTLLKCTVVETGRSVVVRVNDRGPFVRGRIIDLSWGAAHRLGIINQGIANVEVEPIEFFHIPMREAPQHEVPRLTIELDTPEFPLRPITSFGDNDGDDD